MTDNNIAATTTNSGDEDKTEQQRNHIRSTFANDSAFMIAYERALETERGADRALVVDPFAATLAGSKGKELSENFKQHVSDSLGMWPEFHQQLTAVRTKFIDDHLMTRILHQPNNTTSNSNNHKQQQPHLQFVNLGAGLDTRCYRLECMRNISKAFEVDMEVLNAPKRDLFRAVDMPAPLCPNYAIVSVDLLQPNDLPLQLETAGFDSTIPTIFLAEGLIMYLQDQKIPFIEQVSALAAPGSMWILNSIDREKNESNQNNSIMATQDLTNALTAGGWNHVQIHHFGDDVMNYGRYWNDQYPPCRMFPFFVCTKSSCAE